MSLLPLRGMLQAETAQAEMSVSQDVTGACVHTRAHTHTHPSPLSPCRARPPSPRATVLPLPPAGGSCVLRPSAAAALCLRNSDLRPPRPREPFGEESALGPELWLCRKRKERKGVVSQREGHSGSPRLTLELQGPWRHNTTGPCRWNSASSAPGGHPPTSGHRSQDQASPHFAVFIKLLADQSLVGTAGVLGSREERIATSVPAAHLASAVPHLRVPRQSSDPGVGQGWTVSDPV